MREEFLLDRDVVFLNHGSFGACPRQVMEEYWRWQRELEREPVRFMTEHWVDKWDRARRVLADFVGAATYNIAFIENSTYGANTAANSLPLGEGDVVLATDMEYGACKKAWMYHSQRKGFEYREFPLPLQFTSADELIRAVEQAITPEVKVLFISHIVSATAVILPLKDIVELVRSHGIITVVDGAHAPGQINLNLDELGADIYFGNCHKWLLTPKGTAFIYVRPEYQDVIQPPIISWGTDWDDPHPVRFIADLEYQGTRDISAFLTIPAAIEFIKRHNWKEVRATAHRRIAWMSRELEKLLGTEPITRDLSFFGQMYAHPLPPGVNPGQLRSFLWDQYRIEVPVNCVKGTCFIRLSFQAYNTDEEYEIFLKAVETFLQQSN